MTGGNARPSSRKILALCATPEPTPATHAALRASLTTFNDWPRLLAQASHERMVGLLGWHLETLGVRPPPASQRLLLAHQARGRAWAACLAQVLGEVVAVCHALGVDVLLLKGAALMSTVYAGVALHPPAVRPPALRPMDDLDLLLPEGAVAPVRAMLLRRGFVGPPAHGRYERAHHAAPVVWQKAGFRVSVELHRHLPAGGVAERWDQLRPDARRHADFPGAWVPTRRHLLWQGYHHAFRSSLRWVPWRLIWVADLVGLLVQGAFGDQVAPHAYRPLANLHYLTPLPAHVLAQLGGLPPQPRRVGEIYGGWPYKKASPAALWRALTPPPWWLTLRHGLHEESRAHGLQRHFRDLWHEWKNPWDGLRCQ